MNALVRPTVMAKVPSGPIEYRLEQRNGPVVVIFHGGHVRAGLALGEDVFADAGYTVLVTSRPGYGRTPLSTGTSVPDYTDAVRQLCGRLGITRVAAVVGISGGGPTAVTFAARHTALAERLILISAVGWLPFPGRWTRLGTRLAFAAVTEPLTWAAVHTLARRAPGSCLRMMLGSLSLQPVDEVIGALRPDDRAVLAALFTQMRAGHGFVNDLRRTPDVTADVSQPALVIATRSDGGVPFTHAQSLAAAIRHAHLVESHATSHFVWLDPDWAQVAERIRQFMADRPAAAGAADRIPAPVAGLGRSAPRARRGRFMAAFHRPLRHATAALMLAGVLLAAGTAGPAFTRLSPGAGAGFLTVTVAGIAVTVAVLRRVQWVLAGVAVELGGQCTAIAGTMWELIKGPAAGKAAMLRHLGITPVTGLAINLVYSVTAVVLFGWLVRRWLAAGTVSDRHAAEAERAAEATSDSSRQPH